ncbi:radical SAM protein [Desulfovibrio inopinatus]|uniref:radical SAM protein n=1 Tax=Desulfovibrio inopinatus TaxID=102109 RepID=UPI0004111604|nr:radical SAM protein [Desulfovibrio inopinatus]
MSDTKYTYVFGPVHSGRLGISLGLDVLGRRICSFNCPYCEVGVTDVLTVERAPYVPANVIIGELDRFVKEGPDFDVVTLGGLGEPTLNVQFGDILSQAKALVKDRKTAVLTNSAHLDDADVRRELCLADMVLPSLDSLVEDEFKRVNRPHPSCSLDSIRQGLLDFRSMYSGTMCLEILLLDGINDTTENLDRLEDFLHHLRPDRVDVVTMTRPGTSSKIKPASAESLQRFRERLCGVGTKATSTAKKRLSSLDKKTPLGQEAAQDMIISSLRRRPQTAIDLAKAMSMDVTMIEQELAILVERGRVREKRKGDCIFFILADTMIDL